MIGLELHRTGTITYIPIEGGIYGIVTDQADSYQNLYPVGLADEFKVDGLRVSFIATTREDYYAVLPMSILSWGVPIETISISVLGEVPAVPTGEAREFLPAPTKKWYENPWLWIIGLGTVIALSGGLKHRR